MAGSPAGPKPDKTMSSRLLTMKFMQRAAASRESSQPQSTEDSKATTPKRQRLSMDGKKSPATPQSSDMEAIQAALAAEEEKRREALSRQIAESGETQWVLDYSGFDEPETPQPLVVAAGSLDADDDDDMLGGRQSYGNFKRKNQPSEEEIARMIAESKAQGPEKPVKLSQLTSISGSRQGTVGGGGNKSQKKRKHK